MNGSRSGRIPVLEASSPRLAVFGLLRHSGYGTPLPLAVPAATVLSDVAKLEVRRWPMER